MAQPMLTAWKAPEVLLVQLLVLELAAVPEQPVLLPPVQAWAPQQAPMARCPGDPWRRRVQLAKRH